MPLTKFPAVLPPFSTSTLPSVDCASLHLGSNVLTFRKPTLIPQNYQVSLSITYLLFSSIFILAILQLIPVPSPHRFRSLRTLTVCLYSSFPHLAVCWHFHDKHSMCSGWMTECLEEQVDFTTGPFMPSCSVVSDSLRPHGLQPTRLLCPRGSAGKHPGCAAMPSSRGSSEPAEPTHLSHFSCTADAFFTTEPSEKSQRALTPTEKCNTEKERQGKMEKEKEEEEKAEKERGVVASRQGRKEL